MCIDILMAVDTKGDTVFRKTKITQVCDNVCRAERIREQALMTLALQGPRI